VRIESWGIEQLALCVSTFMLTSKLFPFRTVQWMVLEARQMVDEGKVGTTGADDADILARTQALNAFGYEQAAHLVYGMTVDTWKQRHQKKATSEQLARYEASSSLHALHNSNYLAVRVPGAVDAESLEPSPLPRTAQPPTEAASLTAVSPVTAPKLSSNVCCQEDDDDDDDVATVTSAMPLSRRFGGAAVPTTTATTTTTAHTQSATMAVSAPEPATSSTVAATVVEPSRVDLATLPNQQFPVTAILTVSDRAFAGVYETGDLSGPAVIAAIQSLTGLYDLDFITVLVPDDNAAIQAKLKILANQKVDLILTTGGTGFSPRDVTPEATADAVDYELTSLMPWVATAVGTQQQAQYEREQEQRRQLVPESKSKTWPGPTTTLSRGTAGILNTTVIANLPGNPQAVAEIMPVLLPLLLQAVAELHLVTPEILHIG
jgi:molybdopterin adenylyltransferase